MHVYHKLSLSHTHRQGHLSMVVHLMRYGARPEIMDNEGINCLHIAAQFGFNRIMVYLISCRTPLVSGHVTNAYYHVTIIVM